MSEGTEGVPRGPSLRLFLILAGAALALLVCCVAATFAWPLINGGAPPKAQVTGSASPGLSAEPSGSPMAAETPAPTAATTETLVPTATATASPSRTASPRPTATATATPTRTAGPTQTPTLTRTPTPTRTPSPTRTPTYTPSPTYTPTPYISLPQGAHPNGMALDPKNGRLYVAGRDTGMVYVLDERDLSLVKRIPVGKLPFGVTYMNGYVLVANFGSDSVSVIDCSTMQVVATTSTSFPGFRGEQPTFITTLGNYAYVALHRADVLLTHATLSEATATGPTLPSTIHSEIVLAQATATSSPLPILPDSVLVQATPTTTPQLRIIPGPFLLATPTPARGGVIVLSYQKWSIVDSLTVNQGSFGIASLPAAAGPNPSSLLGNVYLSGRDSSDVAVGVVYPATPDPGLHFDTEWVSLRGLSPYFVAANTVSGSRILYFTHSAVGQPANQPGQLSAYNVTTSAPQRINTVNTGNQGDAGGYIAIYPHDGSRWQDTVWISANQQVQVYSWDLKQQMAVIGSGRGIGTNPYAIVINSQSQRVYVADGAGDRVNIIQAATLR